MAIRYTVAGVKSLKKELSKVEGKSQQAIANTLKDVKARGSGWIAKGVAEEYNVKASDIKSGKLGTMKFEGHSTDTLSITYKGRYLTPLHFGMKPKSGQGKDGGRKKYKLTFQVKRDGRPFVSEVNKPTRKQYRQNISKNFRREGTHNRPQSPWMLQRAAASSSTQIPFQRTKQTPNKMDKVLKTVTLPQMVTHGRNGPLHDAPAKYFNEGIEKRMEHHVKRAFK